MRVIQWMYSLILKPWDGKKPGATLTDVLRFPEPPDEALLARIRRDFPAVADLIREGKIFSAVLWEER